MWRRTRNQCCSSDRSLWTMVYGIPVSAGGALLALASALFAMLAMMRRPDDDRIGQQTSHRAVAWPTRFIAVMLWGNGS